MGEEASIGEIGGGGHAGTRDPTGWVRGENGAGAVRRVARASSPLWGGSL